MDIRQKTVRALETFLSELEVDGVCGFFVDPDHDGQVKVVVILDIDFIQNSNTKPEFVARMFRNGVKNEIQKWLGIDVYVGSTAKKCNE
jgi:hypothetical protein